MTEAAPKRYREHPKRSLQPLRVSIPLRATSHIGEDRKEFEGRLEAIDEGKAQICLDQPLALGTRLEVLVEFKDRRNREIQFRYEGRVSSPVSRQWHQVEVSFEEGVGVSGKDAREILADLFPEES